MVFHEIHSTTVRNYCVLFVDEGNWGSKRVYNLQMADLGFQPYPHNHCSLPLWCPLSVLAPQVHHSDLCRTFRQCPSKKRALQIQLRHRKISYSWDSGGEVGGKVRRSVGERGKRSIWYNMTFLWPSTSQLNICHIKCALRALDFLWKQAKEHLLYAEAQV